MSTPQAVAPPGPSASSKTSTSQDWLANLILIAKTIIAATELTPIPYIKGAIGPVVPILEAIEVGGHSLSGTLEPADDPGTSENGEKPRCIQGPV
jgi:hypothetical protein